MYCDASQLVVVVTDRGPSHLFLELKTFALELVVQLVLLELDAFERLDTALDVVR